MRAATRIVKSVLRPWIRRRAKHQLGRLRGVGLPAAGKIADAMDGALASELSPDERRWVDRIEALRTALSRDSAPLSAVPIGPAQSTDARTLEQLAADGMKACTVAEACRASKTYFWSLLLFKLVRTLQPTTAVELGTCLGISAAYQAAAEQLNGRGKLITLEGSASRAALSRKHLESLGLTNASVVTGIFDDTLETSLRENSPIDYAFIDGHHDEHATIKYFQHILPHLVEESVVVFDDIAWSSGMRRAWQALQHHHNIALSIDLLNVGICVVKKAGTPVQHRFRMRMPT